MSEACLPTEEFDSFFDLFDALCLEFVNRNFNSPLLNGCIHEADRLLRLAFDHESLDSATKSQYESLISAKFYLTYGDCLLMFASACRENPTDCKMALDLSLEMYQNCENSLTDLHIKRLELVKQLLNNELPEQVDKDVAEFYNRFTIENIRFFYISSLIFNFFVNRESNELFERVAKAIQQDFNYGILNNRLVAQTYFDFLKCNPGTEEQFETALDFIEIETEEAMSGELIDHLLCADAIHSLILFYFTKCCDVGKVEIIKDKITELLDEINEYSEQLQCSLPTTFVEEKQQIVDFLAQ